MVNLTSVDLRNVPIAMASYFNKKIELLKRAEVSQHFNVSVYFGRVSQKILSLS